MSTEITSYETLLEAARQQPDPQKLLFVFLRAALPDDASPEDKRRFEQGQGGVLVPAFCVGLAPDQLTTYADLVVEADAMSEDWQLVLVAGLGGADGKPPSDQKVDEWLETMQKTVMGGGDLGQFLAFNRAGDPVYFGR